MFPDFSFPGNEILTWNNQPYWAIRSTNSFYVLRDNFSLIFELLQVETHNPSYTSLIKFENETSIEASRKTGLIPFEFRSKNIILECKLVWWPFLQNMTHPSRKLTARYPTEAQIPNCWSAVPRPWVLGEKLFDHWCAKWNRKVGGRQLPPHCLVLRSWPLRQEKIWKKESRL